MNIILINSEKIDVVRTSVFKYKKFGICELDFDSVKKIDSSLCPEEIVQKTNIVYSKNILDLFIDMIRNINTHLYSMIFQQTLAENIIESLVAMLAFMKENYPMLQKTQGNDSINYIIEFLEDYHKACEKYPNAKIKME